MNSFNITRVRTFFTLLFFSVISMASYAQTSCQATSAGFDESYKIAKCAMLELDNAEEVNALPFVTYKVALHLVGNSQGQNWTCDPNDPILNINELLFAPLFAERLISNANNRMEKALVIDDETFDTKVRFELVNGPGCASVFLYDNANQVQYLDDAINLRFLPQAGNSGYTNYGSNRITQRGALVAFLAGENDWWSYGATFLHEFGHTRGLKHSFNCSNPCDGIDLDILEECCGVCCNSDSYTTPGNCPGFEDLPGTSGCWGCGDKNLMMGYNGGSNMTLCEVTEMWSYIANNDRIYQMNCSQPNVIDEIVYDLNAPITWAASKLFDVDVRIKAGTHITALCDVKFTQDKKMIVEEGASFTLDGGRMTTYCADTWKGIKVYGGAPNFAVSTRNEAIIENTSEAAVNMFASGGWLLGDGNAHVDLQSTTFNNCHRMLAMGARQNSHNPSYIVDCTQNGGNYGITNWNCRDVQVIKNTFNNIAKECIVTERGQFNIERNTFNSGRADILFANTNPGLGTTMRNNTFYGTNTGVRSIGAGFGEHLIQKNKFYTGAVDIFMDGDNSYRIQQNDITANFGVISIDNGTHANEVYENQITGNFVGLMPTGTNPSYLFYDNCFNTSFSDVFIDGAVNDFQARPWIFTAANNCFTHQGDDAHPTLDMNGSPFPFTYVLPEDENKDCRDAVKAHINISFESKGDPKNPCASAGTGSGIFPTPYNPCYPQETLEATLDAIDWLTDKIDEIENDPKLSPKQKERLIRVYERCLQRVIWNWLEILKKENRYDEIRDFLKRNQSNKGIMAIYSTYISQDDLKGARNYLLSLRNYDKDMADFITIQLIDLDRLAAGRVYKASDKEKNTVRSIAEKAHPYAGYAKALYYWLTGEIIESTLPRFAPVKSTPRSATGTSKSATATVFPNPFKDHLKVTLNGLENAKVVINDIAGRVLINQEMPASVEFNTDKWSEGIYIVTITAGDKLIRQEKVVLVK